MDRKPENFNHCIYKKDVRRYFDLDDYCAKNGKGTGRINIEEDCPLRKSRIRRYAGKILKALQNRRKAGHRTEDIIQIKTDIVLTDKDGKFIEPNILIDTFIIEETGTKNASRIHMKV